MRFAAVLVMAGLLPIGANLTVTILSIVIVRACGRSSNHWTFGLGRLRLNVRRRGLLDAPHEAGHDNRAGLALRLKPALMGLTRASIFLEKTELWHLLSQRSSPLARSSRLRP